MGERKGGRREAEDKLFTPNQYLANKPEKRPCLMLLWSEQLETQLCLFWVNILYKYRYIYHKSIIRCERKENRREGRNERGKAEGEESEKEGRKEGTMGGGKEGRKQKAKDKFHKELYKVVSAPYTKKETVV